MLELRVTDIKQYMYCPRIIYFTYVCPVQKKVTRKMQYGQEAHLELDRLEKRRTFKRYNFKEGERKFHTGLYSPRLGLEGKLDMHIVAGGEIFPVEFKDEFAALQKKATTVAAFENARVAARIQEILVKQPYIAEDSLAALAIPVVVEQKLDGTFFGLSANLSADAFTFSEPMVLDLKFGEPRKFHRLTTTGYALVMEAIYEFPINIGCLVYAEFKGDRLVVKKDIHIIDDELRQWFIEERDEKMRMIYEEIDPGLGECYDYCPYILQCRG